VSCLKQCQRVELRKETGELPKTMPEGVAPEEPTMEEPMMEEPKVEVEQPAPQGLMARR